MQTSDEPVSRRRGKLPRLFIWGGSLLAAAAIGALAATLALRNNDATTQIATAPTVSGPTANQTLRCQDALVRRQQAEAALAQRPPPVTGQTADALAQQRREQLAARAAASTQKTAAEADIKQWC
jgi:hypothetical protein